MILGILKSNRAVNFILIPLMAVLFWMKSILEPHPYPFYRGETANLLFSPVYGFVKDSPLLQHIVSLVMLVFIAFLVLQINNRYNFIRIRTMLPAPLFIIMVSGFTGVHAFHPVYPASVFVLMAIYRLFSAFDKTKSYSAAFDTGLLLGIASLFYFNASILFPAFFLGIGILTREFQWREFALNFTGFLLPFVFAFSYTFFTDQFLELLKTFELNILTSNNHFRANVPLQIFSGYLVFLVFLGSIKIIQQYDSKKESTRKFFTVFFLTFIFPLLSFIFIPATSQEMLVIMAIPVTFLVSNFFTFLKSRFWGELLFYLLLIFVIALQILA